MFKLSTGAAGSEVDIYTNVMHGTISRANTGSDLETDWIVPNTVISMAARSESTGGDTFLVWLQILKINH